MLHRVREAGQNRARMSTTPRHGRALLLAAAFLASALAAATAQDDEYVAGQQQVHVSKSMIALLVAVVAVFVFIACSTIYLRHCTASASSNDFFDGHGRAMINLDHTAFIGRRPQRRPRGLDAEVVRTFPTMKYAEAKALRVGKQALECAVCLSEFEDEERLTMLPRCSHAFHPDCIGEWLAGHVTCPVCRCNLDPNHRKDTTSSSGGDDEQHPATSFPFPATASPQQAANSSVSSEVTALRHEDGAQRPVAVVIDVVTEEEEEERLREAIELQQIGSLRRRAMRSSRLPGPGPTTRLARSHSTGRSLAVRLDRDLERFTLRLPEHVRREMVAASEHSLELLSRRGRGAGAGDGEGSGRGGGRSGPLGGRAARWQSLIVRTFSGKVSFFSASRVTVSSDGGEVSSTSSSSSRVRGKRVAAVDAANDVPVVKGGFLRLDRIGGGPSGAKDGTVLHEAAPDEEKKAVT